MPNLCLNAAIVAGEAHMPRDALFNKKVHPVDLLLASVVKPPHPLPLL
ncbi:uncharacterized protein ARMOST_17422 [Armillaria ostoyae]|uniref:Uncharacterized protein n=1 Tax=Armillaria ostoyae TaxID=47428 RepID=A0A284RZ28_ARMOS|nr:uncharacterized protein ARMOST_17422 [Armillaria ostoyae]